MMAVPRNFKTMKIENSGQITHRHQKKTILSRNMMKIDNSNTMVCSKCEMVSIRSEEGFPRSISPEVFRTTKWQKPSEPE
jgi:hypothetical protein